MEIFKEFTFEAAHKLPNVPAGHKCGRLHGHSFHMTVTVEGPVAADTGWVMDFGDIKKAVQPTLDIIDHSFLNELGGVLYNPTSENVAWWLWERLSQSLPTLKRITIRETCTSGATYEGPEN